MAPIKHTINNLATLGTRTSNERKRWLDWKNYGNAINKFMGNIYILFMYFIINNILT